MKRYWAILSKDLPTRDDAYDFRNLMVGNGISFHKLKIIKVGWYYRVIRRIHDTELDDPMLGNKACIAQYRRWLERQTKIVDKWLKKPVRKRK